MPSKLAVAKCPNLIFVKPRFEVYRAVSAQIHDVFRRYTDIVEPVALDEAYLDVTENKQGLPYASTVAQYIRREIFTETNLTASAGVSVNKFLAKIARNAIALPVVARRHEGEAFSPSVKGLPSSRAVARTRCGMNKPNGMTVILPEEAEAFVESLPIEKFHGIGKVTAAKMHALGIDNGLDLKERSLNFLIKSFGKAGNYYYNIARARDERAVEANRIRKSIGAENSFAEDLRDCHLNHKLS